MAKSKHEALGRGADAVFGSLPPLTAMEVTPSPVASPVSLPKGITMDEAGTLWAELSLLKPNPHQPRQFFDEEKLAELTESVRQKGVISPVIIENAGDGSFFIIAGERRTRAAREAGLEKIPVQLRSYSEPEKLTVALIENIQRTDLNPIEEAQAYAAMMQLEALTQEEVAMRVGKNRATVANSLRLLKLPQEIQNALASATISAGHARPLLSVENPADQTVLFKRIVNEGLSVRECEEQARLLNGGGRISKKDKPKPNVDTRDPNYIALEQDIQDALGTKVVLKGSFSKGTITIDYFTADDLDRIYNVITKKGK